MPDDFLDFVLDQLRLLPGVVPKRMFGAVGLYHRGIFFAIVDAGSLYLKVDDATRPEFVARGMGPFEPKPGMVLRTYHEVPAEVLDDPEELARWSERAIACQAGATKRKPGKRRKAR